MCIHTRNCAHVFDHMNVCTHAIVYMRFTHACPYMCFCCVLDIPTTNSCRMFYLFFTLVTAVIAAFPFNEQVASCQRTCRTHLGAVAIACASTRCDEEQTCTGICWSNSHIVARAACQLPATSVLCTPEEHARSRRRIGDDLVQQQVLPMSYASAVASGGQVVALPAIGSIVSVRVPLPSNALVATRDAPTSTTPGPPAWVAADFEEEFPEENEFAYDFEIVETFESMMEPKLQTILPQMESFPFGDLPNLDRLSRVVNEHISFADPHGEAPMLVGSFPSVLKFKQISGIVLAALYSDASIGPNAFRFGRDFIQIFDIFSKKVTKLDFTVEEQFAIETVLNGERGVDLIDTVDAGHACKLHVDNALTFIRAKRFSDLDVASYCNEHAVALFACLSAAADPLPITVRSLLSRIARFCAPFELVEVAVVRPLLSSTDNSLFSMADYSETSITVDQDSMVAAMANGVEIVSEVSRCAFVMDRYPHVRFAGSPAEGEGNRVQWLSSMIDQLFNPANGLFEFSDDREIFVKPLRSVETFEYLKKLKAIGRIIGMGIKDGISMGISLTPGALLLLRGGRFNDEALMSMWKQEDPVMAQNTEMLRYTRVDGLLFPDDDSRTVNFGDPENVEEYIAAIRNFRVVDSIETAMKEMRRGIYDVLPVGELGYYSVAKLGELLMGETTPLNIPAVQLAATVTIPPQQAEWFWEILNSFEPADIEKFLLFVSGSPRVPLGGLKSIQIIPSIDEADSLPKTHICVLQIQLPTYSSIEVMRNKLLYAIYNAGAIDLAP